MLLPTVKQNLYSVKIAAIRNHMARASRETRTIRPAARRRAAKTANGKPGRRGSRSRGRNPLPQWHPARGLARGRGAGAGPERPAGLDLPAVAREAGVSHAAPTHHFGDLTGLLSELAAIGYRQFSAAMTAAKASGTLQEQGLAAARAYVAFAQAHPGMYGLMFRAER